MIPATHLLRRSLLSLATSTRLSSNTQPTWLRRRLALSVEDYGTRRDSSNILREYKPFLPLNKLEQIDFVRIVFPRTVQPMIPASHLLRRSLPSLATSIRQSSNTQPTWLRRRLALSVKDYGIRRDSSHILREYKPFLPLNKLEQIDFVSFIGRDSFYLSDLMYLVQMSDGWKMIALCDAYPLYQTIDGLCREGATSPVFKHMALTGARVQSVRVLELGYEDRDLNERLKEVVSTWANDDLLNVENNPWAETSRLHAVYDKARGSVLLNQLTDTS